MLPKNLAFTYCAHNNYKNHSLKRTVIEHFPKFRNDSINSGPSIKYSAIIRHCFNTQNSTSRFSETCKPHKMHFTNHLKPRDPKSTEWIPRPWHFLTHSPNAAFSFILSQFHLSISSLVIDPEENLSAEQAPSLLTSTRPFHGLIPAQTGCSLVPRYQCWFYFFSTDKLTYIIFLGSQTTFPNTLVK